MNVKFVVLGVLAVGRYKGAARIVEYVQHARCNGNPARRMVATTTSFEGRVTPAPPSGVVTSWAAVANVLSRRPPLLQSLQIAAEAHAVALDVFVAQFGEVTVKDRRVLGELMYHLDKGKVRQPGLRAG